ncbi:hypothetical protein [Pedobacter arcticus]|uniref:hypothetical protein n=1 Tax=Pedobacter arcticus TaxID=752140 RepID=UPI0002DFEA2A|nr:hypothetical protein [Pedobacter arcticus]
MNSTYRSLLLRYQNYLLEFYQLIEDKEVIVAEDAVKATAIKKFLENLPDFESEFEIELGISSAVEGFENNWLIQISDDGFSVRSYTVDGLDETDEWFFHYHDDTKEYEGNLFADGDWDLFLEEVADIDDFDGKVLSTVLTYSLG